MSEIKDLTVGEISSMLRADADAVAREMLPAGRYENGGMEWRCTGRNSPIGTAISVHVGRGPKQGICGFWNHSLAGGDLLDLFRVINDSTAAEAVAWAKGRLGLDDAPATRLNLRTVSRRRVSRDEEYSARMTERRLESASAIWKESHPLAGAGSSYLKSRGIDPIYAGTEIRLHNSLPHPSGGVFPALVARIRDVEGKATGIWRVFLKPTGEGKAPVDNPKLGLGKATGGAVRLGGVWPEIGLAEGIETALACRQITSMISGSAIPVWATLSTSGLRGVVLPSEIESVRIYADADPVKYRNGKAQPSAGISSANELAERLRQEGRKVRVEIPHVGQDWLDVLNATQTKKVTLAA